MRKRRHGTWRHIAPWASILLLVPILPRREASAGALDVLAIAAFTGDFGLRVTVGVPCTQSELVVPPGTVSSNQLACNSITAGNVEVVGPGSTFTAGDRVILQNGFSVASGVSFVARIDPFVKSPFAYVRDDKPTAETTYNAEFSLRVDGLNLAMGDEIGHFVGYSANGMPRFRVVLRRSVSETRAAILAWDDGAGELVEHSTDFLLPPGYHRIHLSWRAGAGDGEFLIAIDGSGVDGLTSLNNGTSRIDFVKWGAVDGTLASSTGWMELDDFSSWR